MKLLFEKQLSDQYAEEVRQILYKADEEFVPTLSSRNGTTQKNLGGSGTQTNTNQVDAEKEYPVAYFEVMRQQAFILALQDEKVVGFLSYIPHHSITVAGKALECAYASTIIVEKACRGKKITEAMYGKLYEVSEDAYVATRTWSLNHAHIHILEKEGFCLAETLKDDRGPGVDTVYYVKELV